MSETEWHWAPGGAPMTLEQAAMVLLDPDADPAEWTEAARVANEARAKWGWPDPIPALVCNREIFICSLCGLDLEEDEQDDGASAHDACRLDDALKAVEAASRKIAAWEPVVRAVGIWLRIDGWTPTSVSDLAEAYKALPEDLRP